MWRVTVLFSDIQRLADVFGCPFGFVRRILFGDLAAHHAHHF
jgi:hypothetical protein